MKEVIYEHQADAAIQTARALFSRLGDTIEIIEWAIVRDPGMGTALAPTSKMRMVVFQGGASVGLPTVEVVFEVRAECIVFHDLVFRK